MPAAFSSQANNTITNQFNSGYTSASSFESKSSILPYHGTNIGRNKTIENMVHSSQGMGGSNLLLGNQFASQNDDYAFSPSLTMIKINQH